MIFRKNTKKICGRIAKSVGSPDGYRVIVYRKKGDEGYRKNCNEPFLSIEYSPLGEDTRFTPVAYVWLPSAVEDIDVDLKKGGHIDTFEKLVNSYRKTQR